jgi:hypothetical protein
MSSGGSAGAGTSKAVPKGEAAKNPSISAKIGAKRIGDVGLAASSSGPGGTAGVKVGNTKEVIIGNPQGLNAFAYCLNNPANTIDPDGYFVPLAVFGYIAAAKVMAIGTAWLGLWIAEHSIGNPLAYPNEARADSGYLMDYHVSDMTNDLLGGVGMLNTGLILGAATADIGVGYGISLYPQLMAAAGTPRGQDILKNTNDFVQNYILTGPPGPSAWPGWTYFGTFVSAFFPSPWDLCFGN